MRYIRTTNDYVEFVETDASEKIISTKGFKFGVLYFQVKNGKVTFYLNDQENPWRNDIWSINIPFSIDGIDCTTEEEAVAELQKIMQIDKTVIATVEWEDYYTKEESDERYELKGSGSTIVDDELDINSKNAVANSAITIAIDSKLDASAYTPTDLSNYDTKDEVNSKIESAVSGKMDTSAFNEYSAETKTTIDGKLDASAYTPTDLSNYDTKEEVNSKIESATSGKVDTSVFNSYSAETKTVIDGKLDASAYTPTDLSDYYKKSETSGKSELEAAFNLKQDKSGMTNYSTTVEMNAAINAATSGKADIDDIPSVDGYFDGAAYDSQTKRINFKHNNEILAYIDATDFIKDGMVSSVEIRNGKLVITFNSDAGKEAIELNISDIFNADNYYTKDDVDTELAKKADTATTYTKTEVNDLLDDKLDATAYTPTDLSNYDTKAEVNSKIETATSGKVDTSVFNSYSASVETELDSKLDATAYTPTDLSNYYTKSETSGATQISTALSGKQDTLIAGDNITISGNVISATGGGGTQVQSDWNENNSGATAYIKNRTHYTYEDYAVERTLSSNTAVQIDDTHYGLKNEWVGTGFLESGKKYRVTIGEDEYVVTATTLANGNVALNVEEGAASPLNDTWSIYKDTSDSDWQATVAINDSSLDGQPISVKVEKWDEIVVPLENKYLGLPISGNTNNRNIIANYFNNSISNNSYGCFAEGTVNTIGDYSNYSHAEGSYNTISGSSNNSHAEGYNNKINSSSYYSHAEGGNNTISSSSYYSHAEGNNNTISGYSYYSHAEGGNNTISSNSSYSHTEGYNNNISGDSYYSHAEGYNNVITGYSYYSHAEGNNNTISDNSYISHAEGGYNTISSNSYYSHAEGNNNKIISGSQCSHAEGYGNTISDSSYSHAEGSGTTASGKSSHAEGIGTKAYGIASHAEGGYDSVSYGEYGNIASGDYSHAEGNSTTASGKASHAEGIFTNANGMASHVEGSYTTASGDYSHAEGYATLASGDSSHAEGQSTQAKGAHSHAEGIYTVANNYSEHVSGFFNLSSSASTTLGNSGNTLFSVGNGNSSSQRHNALEIRQSGDIYVPNTNASGEYYAKPMIKLQDYTQFKIVQLTQAQYDALSSKDNSTLYVIVN